MQFKERRNSTRWIIIITSFVIVILIMWNTYSFFQIFKNEERIKMELWGVSMKTLLNADPESTEVELPRQIISNNTTIPVILVENNEIINFVNIDEQITSDESKLNSYLKKLKKENEPIKIERDKNKFQYLYYGNSSLLNKLKYYPVALLLIIFLFGAVVYNFYRSTKMATKTNFGPEWRKKPHIKLGHHFLH